MDRSGGGMTMGTESVAADEHEVPGGFTGLNAEETKLVKSLRRLRAAEAAPAKVPRGLLEHGYVTMAKAAKLLGVPLAEVKKHGDRNAFMSEDERMPISSASKYFPKGTIPTSEVYRQWKRTQRSRLEKLAKATVNLVKTEGVVSNWATWNLFESDIVAFRDFLGLDEVADELGLSKAAVGRLVDDVGPNGLFAQRHRRLYGLVVTREEVAAYKRKLEREAKTANAA